MNMQIPAVLLILGFISVLVASTIGPPGLYQEPSVERQLELVAEYRTIWIVSNVFFGLAGVLSAAGLTLIAINLRGSGAFLATAAGAALYGVGALAYLDFLYRRTVNPAELFTNYAFSPRTVVLLGAMVIGLLLTGAAYLQAGFPQWLGILMVGGMGLIGGAALVFPAQFFKMFPPQVLFLFTFVAGIVLLRLQSVDY